MGHAAADEHDSAPEAHAKRATAEHVAGQHFDACLVGRADAEHVPVADEQPLDAVESVRRRRLAIALAGKPKRSPAARTLSRRPRQKSVFPRAERVHSPAAAEAATTAAAAALAPDPNANASRSSESASAATAAAAEQRNTAPGKQ